MTRTVVTQKISVAAPPAYAVQEAEFVKFIALANWVEARLRFTENAWTSMHQLRASYAAWVASQPGWRIEVIDTPNGFSRKLSTILGAKGVSFTLSRRKGTRGMQGVCVV